MLEVEKQNFLAVAAATTVLAPRDNVLATTARSRGVSTFFSLFLVVIRPLANSTIIISCLRS